MADDGKLKAFNDLYLQVAWRGADWPLMRDFLPRLTVDELQACIDLYMVLYPKQSPTGPGALKTFVALMQAGLDRLGLYFALAFEARVNARSGPWPERFKAIGNARGRLIRTAKAWRKRLSGAQAKFLRLFEAAMPGGSTGAIEAHLAGLSAEDAAECLEAYIAVSQRWPNETLASLKVFFAASYSAIEAGGGDFAGRYQSRVTSGGVWSLRYGGLSDAQRADLAKAIERAYGRRPSPQAPASKPPAPPSTATTRTFAAMLRGYFAANDLRTKGRLHTELDAYLSDRTLEERRDCFEVFLRLAAEFPADKSEVLNVYYRLVLQLAHSGESYDALNIRHLARLEGGVAFLRHNALDAERRKTVEAELDWSIARPRVLDRLKHAYYKRNLRRPKPSELLAFARMEFEHSESVAMAMADCHNFFDTAIATSTFAEAFQRFADIVTPIGSKTSALLAMLQTARDETRVHPLIKAELYRLTLLMVYDQARLEYPEAYDHKDFNAEERGFLIDSVGLSPAYEREFEERLFYMRAKRGNRTDAAAVAKAYAVLMQMALRIDPRASLVSMTRTEEIVRDMNRLRERGPEAFDLIQIPIAPQFGAHQLTLGQTLGSAYLVWSDRRIGKAYIEIAQAQGMLFEIDSFITLGRISSNDAFYGAIWRNTAGMVEIIAVFFKIIGYLPDLVSGGMAGLIEAVLVGLASDALAERWELNNGEAFILNALLGTLAAGARERMVGGSSPGLDAADINELTADYLKRASHAPDAPVPPMQRMNAPEARLARGMDEALENARLTGGPAGERTPALLGDGSSNSRAPGGAADQAHLWGEGEPSGSGPRETVDDYAAAKAKKGDDRFEIEDAEVVSYQPAKKTALSRKGDDPRALSGKPAPRTKAVKGRGLRLPPTRIPSRFYAEGILVDVKDPLLKRLEEQGYTVRFIPAKNSHRGAAAAQLAVNPSGTELEIISPSGIWAHIDVPAVDSVRPHVLVIGEVKATFVANPEETAHIGRWEEKATQVAKYMALAMENPGRFKVEVIATAPLLPSGGSSLVAAEAYSAIAQSIVPDLMRLYPQQSRDYAARALNKSASSLTEAEIVRELETSAVDRLFEVSVVEFGRVRTLKR